MHVLLLLLMSFVSQATASSASPITRASDASWRQGREYFTDFASSAADALIFDVSGFTYTTDGGENAVHLADPDVLGYVRTKDRLADVDILVKLRLLGEGLSSILNVSALLNARYQDDNNRWYGTGVTTDGNNHLHMHSIKTSTDAQAAGTAGGFDNTDATTYRWMRLRLTGDVMRLKWWFAGSSEPAWQMIKRLRPTSAGGSNAEQDNVDVGVAGLSIIYGGFIQSIRVAELLKVDENLLPTPAPNEIETDTGCPVAWFKNGSDSTNVRSVASIAGPDGDSRPVFKLVRTNVAETTNGAWTTAIYRSGSASTFHPRKMPWPRVVAYPHAVEVSLWTKGDSIALPSGTLGATFVCYYYDDQGGVLNFEQPDYFATLGPNGATGGAGGKKGTGTWDWTLTRWRMHFEHWERVTALNIDVGFHDGDATGTLWFTDLQLRPVP